MLYTRIIAAPLPFMFTETGVVVALTHVLMPFMVLSVWAALQLGTPEVLPDEAVEQLHRRYATSYGQ